MSIWAIAVAVGLPSTLVSVLVGLMVRRVEKRLAEEQKAKQEHEAARKQFEAFQVRGLTAAMALGEATALALQHGRCNGETHAALAYMKEVKREQRDFLAKQGINHIFEED